MIPDDYLFDDEDGLNEDAVNFESLYIKVRDALAFNEPFYLEPIELEDAIIFFIDSDAFEKALLITNYATEMYPDGLELLLLKAEIFIELKRLSEALNLLERVEEGAPFLTDIYLHKVAIFDKLNEHEKILPEYQRALINNVEEPDIIYEEMGHYLTLKGRYEEAAQSFKQGINLNQDSAQIFDAYVNLCLIHLGTMEGLAFFEEFTTIFPENEHAWLSVGKLFAKEEMYYKAIQAFETVLRKNNHHLDAIDQVLDCLKMTRQYNRIIQICKHYRSFNHPYFVYQLAEVYLDMGDYELALQSYYSLYDEDPNDTMAIIGIARCFESKQEHLKAINFIDQGLKVNPESAELYIYKGILLKNISDFDEAINVFVKALQFFQDFDNAELYFELADVYVEIKDFKSAADVLYKGLEDNPGHNRLMCFLAACLYNINRKDEAYALLDEVLSVDNSIYDLFLLKCPAASEDIHVTDIIDNYKND